MNGIIFHINNALYTNKSIRNLLIFKDTHENENGYHVEIMNEGNIECLYIIYIVSNKKIIVKKTSNFLIWVESYNYKAH